VRWKRNFPREYLLSANAGNFFPQRLGTIFLVKNNSTIFKNKIKKANNLTLLVTLLITIGLVALSALITRLRKFKASPPVASFTITQQIQQIDRALLLPLPFCFIIKLLMYCVDEN
jgi:peptidoglycan biosynthesis protein MviN/MurJ (putative lipid II flippase)